MGHANVDAQGRLWTITEQLSQGDTPTVVTEQVQRTLKVEETPIPVRQNPFPYDGLFAVLRDGVSGKEYSLLIPENETLAPRLVSPSNAHGESVHSILVDGSPAITGTTADDLGIPLR